MQCKVLRNANLEEPHVVGPYRSSVQKVDSTKIELHRRDGRSAREVAAKESSDVPPMLTEKQSQPVRLPISPRKSSLQSSAALSAKNGCTLLSTQGSTRDSSIKSAKASRKGGQRSMTVDRRHFIDKCRYEPQRLSSNDLQCLPELSNHDGTSHRCPIDLTTPETLSLQMPTIKHDPSLAHHCKAPVGSNAAPIQGQTLNLSEETLSPKYLENRPIHQSVIDAIAHTQAGEWMYKYIGRPAHSLESEYQQEFQAMTTFYPFRAKMANLSRSSRRWFRLIASERAITWVRRHSKGSERATLRDIQKCESVYQAVWIKY